MKKSSIVASIIFIFFIFLASLSAQTETIVWKPAHDTSLKNTLVLTGHTKSIRSAVFSHDDATVVTASDDGTVKTWNARTGAAINTFTWSGSWILSATYNQDGKNILISNWGAKTANIIDANTGRSLITFAGHTEGVWWSAYSHDESKVATSSWDKTAKVWDAKTGQNLLTLRGHTEGIACVVFSLDDSKIATAGWDHTAKIWDAKTGAELMSFRHPSIVNSVMFTPDATKLLTASSDGAVRVWDVATAKELIALKGHGSSAVVYAAYNHDTSKIISAAKDNVVKIWDAKTGAELQTLRGHTDHVWNATFSTGGTKAASVGLDQSLRIWKITSQNPFESAARSLEAKMAEYVKAKFVKGEFESKAEYLDRVKKMQNSISSIRAELLQTSLQEELGSPKLEWARYDADERKVYLKLNAANAEYSRQISFSATPTNAKDIKDGVSALEPYVYFTLTNQSISISILSREYIHRKSGQ